MGGQTQEKFILRSRSRFWAPLTLAVVAVTGLLQGIWPELTCGPQQAWAFCIPEESVLRDWMGLVSNVGIAFFSGGGVGTALLLWLSSKFRPDNKRTGEKAKLTIVPFKPRRPGPK